MTSPDSRFRGPVLPDGETRELYVVDGRVTYEQQRRRRDGGGGLDRARASSTPTATSGLDDDGAISDEATEQQAVADRDAGALLIRDCGSAADTALDPRARRPAPADPRRPAHRPHQALHPQLRPRGRARRAGGARRPGGAARRRLGQAGRRLDLPRGRRPGAVVPAGGVRRGDPGRPRARRQGHRPLLRRGRAARPDRGRHRLHRARHRALAPTWSTRWSSAAWRWCRR